MGRSWAWLNDFLETKNVSQYTAFVGPYAKEQLRIPIGIVRTKREASRSSFTLLLTKSHKNRSHSFALSTQLVHCQPHYISNTMLSDLSYSTISRVLGKFPWKFPWKHWMCFLENIGCVLCRLPQAPTLTLCRLCFPFLYTESWEIARRLPNFEEVFGTVILLKMFDEEPQTKEVFGFSVDYKPCPQELKDSGNLQIAIFHHSTVGCRVESVGPWCRVGEFRIVHLVIYSGGEVSHIHVSLGRSMKSLTIWENAMSSTASKL